MKISEISGTMTIQYDGNCTFQGKFTNVWKDIREGGHVLTIFWAAMPTNIC
jgi:hypothetical protein